MDVEAVVDPVTPTVIKGISVDTGSEGSLKCGQSN